MRLSASGRDPRGKLMFPQVRVSVEPPVRIELRPILTDADRPLERGGDADVPLTCIFFLSVRRIQAHSGRNRRDGTSSGKVGVAASPTPPGPTFTRTPRETRDEPTSGSSPKSEVHLARGRQLKQARHSPWRRDRHIGCWAPPSADATAVRGRSLYGAKALVSDTLSRGARCISANIRQALAGRSTVEPRACGVSTVDHASGRRAGPYTTRGRGLSPASGSRTSCATASRVDSSPGHPDRAGRARRGARRLSAPVREALRILESAGPVALKANTGAWVSPPGWASRFVSGCRRRSPDDGRALVGSVGCVPRGPARLRSRHRRAVSW